GFTVGPIMTRLVSIYETLPFIVSATLSLLMWLLIFLVQNDRPNSGEDRVKTVSSMKWFKHTMQYAWVYMLPVFTYGLLESSLHGIFPIYGLIIRHDVEILSLIIPLFALASIITQLLLGMLIDRFGRKNILMFVFSVGIICFILAGMLEASVTALDRKSVV